MNDAWHQQMLLVIPSLNGGRLLARMLPTLRLDPSRIVVLDQGSTDDSVRVCLEAGVELIQLSEPHTYTQACNIGERLARERGCTYVCISNNDIACQTNVMRELWEAMESDPSLGIVAPSQVIVDETCGEEVLSARVLWRLDRVEFLHDTQPVEGFPDRLEADFCELTCALVRLSAVAEIGFLDEEYGFYHEDADFGFRLRLAGFGCAYLPASQIHHFSSSTFNREPLSRKIEFLRRNRALFARKHLGYRLRHSVGNAEVGYGPRAVEASLHPILERYGLLDRNGPALRSPSLAGEGADYLHVTLDAPATSARRLSSLSRAGAVFSASKDLLPHLAAAGVTQAFHLPLGVDTEVFHPWVKATRLRPETTILSVLDASEQRSLQAVVNAWQNYQIDGQAWLILVGRGLCHDLGTPHTTFTTGEFDVARYDAHRIEVHEPTEPLTATRRAILYRGVDALLLAACGEAAPLPAIEAMASGVPCIMGDYGLHGEVAGEAALTYGPGPVALTGAEHWSPSIEGVVACLHRLEMLTRDERDALRREGLRRVRGNFTTRHAAVALYRALPHLQERDPSRLLRELEQQRPPVLSPTRGVLSGSVPVSTSARIARRVRSVGHLAARFGSVWEETGLLDAGHAAMRRMLSFMQRRTARLGRPALNHVQFGARDFRSSLQLRFKQMLKFPLLVGYIDGQLGLGESLRGLALAMARSGISFHTYPVGLGIEGRQSVPFMPDRVDKTSLHAVNVIEVTVDELPRVLQYGGRPRFERSYNVLRTYWELSRAPESWRSNLERIHEIWAPNVFVAESFRLVFDGPITVIPPCVQILERSFHNRAELGLEESRHYFIFSFDFFSFPQRKNPLAVIRAFRKAFDGLSPSVGLILKATGAPNAYSDLRAELHAAAAYDERITIIDESISRKRMLSLIAASDCYVSLHRAEGFGLGMAEALALGKPVIGTGYSGNTEFLTEDTGYPVPFALRPIMRNEYIHTAGQVWAEPDVAAASAAMRRVVANPQEAARRAEAGRRFVLDRYGLESVGRLVAARLNEIEVERESTS